MAVSRYKNLVTLAPKSDFEDRTHLLGVVHHEHAKRMTISTTVGGGLPIWLGRPQVQDRVQPRDREDLKDLGTQIAKGQTPAGRMQSLVKFHQHAKCHAGNGCHVAHVEDQRRAVPLIDKGYELIMGSQVL